jgi:hypothetical protein
MSTSMLKFCTLKLLAFVSFVHWKQWPSIHLTSNARSHSGRRSTQCVTVAADSTNQSQAFRLSPPLRVRHIVEAGQQRYGAGRMVISGRMADVCAELDRLAACETAMT